MAPSRRASPTERDLLWLVPLLLVAVAFGVGFPALDQYNVTWDEALGDLFFGERYFSYFTSFDRAYLAFDANPYPAERTPDLGLSPWRQRPWEFYPFANTLAGGTSALLARTLGWLDAFDGFHALNLLLVAVLVWVFFRFLAERYDLVAATTAIVLLLTSPRVFCHMMANIKDFPLMVLFTLACVAFLRAFESGSTRGLLASGVLWGFALATKANALFVPLIGLIVLGLGGLPERWRQRRGALALSAAGAAVIGVSVMVCVWPYLWTNTIARFARHFDHIQHSLHYTRTESIAPMLPNLLFTTPPVFLALFAVGLVPCIRSAWKRERASLLLLAWIFVAAGRFALPGAVNFDGVRHFLEFFPAMAAVAGMGAAWLAKGIASALPRPRWIPAGLAILLLLPGCVALARSHPFQIAYWNFMIGGFPGARAKPMAQASDYWGMSYRQGLRWLSEYAPPDSLLVVPVVEHAVRLVASERLRADIELLRVTRPNVEIPPGRLAELQQMSEEHPMFVMFVDRRDWRNSLMIDCLRNLRPLKTWDLEGEPVLRIYRYSAPAWRR